MKRRLGLTLLQTEEGNNVEVKQFAAVTEGISIPEKKGGVNEELGKGRSNTQKVTFGSETYYLKIAAANGFGMDRGPEENFNNSARQAIMELFACNLANAVISDQIPEAKLFVVENSEEKQKLLSEGKFLSTGGTVLGVGLKEVKLGDTAIKQELTEVLRSQNEGQSKPILIEELASYKVLSDAQKSSLQKTLALSAIIGNSDLRTNLSLVKGVLTTHDWGESFNNTDNYIMLKEDLENQTLTLPISNESILANNNPKLSIEPGEVKKLAEAIKANIDKVYKVCSQELKKIGFINEDSRKQAEQNLANFKEIAEERAKATLQILEEIELKKERDLESLNRFREDSVINSEEAEALELLKSLPTSPLFLGPLPDSPLLSDRGISDGTSRSSSSPLTPFTPQTPASNSSLSSSFMPKPPEATKSRNPRSIFHGSSPQQPDDKTPSLTPQPPRQTLQQSSASHRKKPGGATPSNSSTSPLAFFVSSSSASQVNPDTRGQALRFGNNARVLPSLSIPQKGDGNKDSNQGRS